MGTREAENDVFVASLWFDETGERTEIGQRDMAERREDLRRERRGKVVIRAVCLVIWLLLAVGALTYGVEEGSLLAGLLLSSVCAVIGIGGMSSGVKRARENYEGQLASFHCQEEKFRRLASDPTSRRRHLQRAALSGSLTWIAKQTAKLLFDADFESE